MAGSFQFLRGVPMLAFFSPGNKPGTVAGRHEELEWQAHVTFFHHGDRRWMRAAIVSGGSEKNYSRSKKN